MTTNSVPMICNRNSLNHIDYGIPLTANKSTDYRTSTGSFHSFFPEYPDEYNCRIKVNLRDDWKYKDVALKDATFKSLNRTDYVQKYSQTRICDSYRKAPRQNKDYTRNVQEKMFANPPMPIVPKISTMKDDFRINYAKLNTREVLAPACAAICPVQGLGRDEQPPVRPEKQGFWKWLDPYLTTNKSTHIHFSKNQRENAKKDFPTYYNTYGKWPGFNGLLPPASGNRCIIDPVPFTHMFPNRNLPKITKRVPHSGIESEYSENYKTITKSDLAPFIETAGVEFPESLSQSSAWQNLAAPGMYCTEYFQIGSNKSGRNIIQVDKASKKDIVHHTCRFKLTDSFKQ